MNSANAQAPNSVAGDGFLVGISSGTFPFASSGYYLFIPANTGNSYQSIGIYNVSISTGTYGYTPSSPSAAALSINDSLAGLGTVSVSFATLNSGSFYSTLNSYPSASQTGNFSFASSNAPSSIVGKTIVCTISDGLSPFANIGSFTIHAAASGNTYTILGDGVGTANSSGTYSYSLANRSTGKLQITDSLIGASTVYLGLADASAGGYAITQPATGGFQIGSFMILDTTPPTVTITNPPSAKTYTNAQTVSLSATAADNFEVANVEFYDGATLKGSDSTPAYTLDWSFTDADNGAHVWTARAYDAAGNVSTSSPVTLTVSIDITSPTVFISSPTNGANLATSPTTVSGTAIDPGSPTSGLAVVEVRVNSGSWSNATGTTTWTRSVTLSPCPNTIEARSLDKAGNYSAIVSNFVSYVPPNTVPNKPTNISPAAGLTGVSLTPTLQATGFSDPDCVGDSHAASQWQVLNSSGVNVVADSGTDVVNTASWTVPAAKLYYGSNYQWRVRYRDSRNGWSSNSTATAFTTAGPLLNGTKQGTDMIFKWPTNAPGFSLQWVTNLGLAYWSNATPAPVIVGGQYTVTNSITNNAKFYRLKK